MCPPWVVLFAEDVVYALINGDTVCLQLHDGSASLSDVIAGMILSEGGGSSSLSDLIASMRCRLHAANSPCCRTRPCAFPCCYYCCVLLLVLWLLLRLLLLFCRCRRCPFVLVVVLDFLCHCCCCRSHQEQKTRVGMRVPNSLPPSLPPSLSPPPPSLFSLFLLSLLSLAAMRVSHFSLTPTALESLSVRPQVLVTP